MMGRKGEEEGKSFESRQSSMKSVADGKRNDRLDFPSSAKKKKRKRKQEEKKSRENEWIDDDDDADRLPIG